MILVCPSCAARFMIPDGALGAAGRTVRCGACGHSWHQFPEPAVARAETPPVPAAVPAPSTAPPVAAPAAKETSPVAPVLASAPADEAARIAAEAETALESDSKKRKWSWRGRSSAKAEPEAKSVPASATLPAPEIASSPALAIAGAADTAAREVAAREVAAHEVAAADAEGARGRRGVSRVLVWFLFVFIVTAIVLGGHHYRQDVVRLWPPATRLYQVLGIAVDPPSGYWLRVPEDSIKFRREADSGTPILVVSGEILNQSEKPQRVAPMRILLLDKEGRVLRTERVKIDDRTLDPGKRMPFQTSIPNSPPEAVAVRITFDVSG